MQLTEKLFPCITMETRIKYYVIWSQFKKKMLGLLVINSILLSVLCTIISRCFRDIIISKGNHSFVRKGNEFIDIKIDCINKKIGF